MATLTLHEPVRSFKWQYRQLDFGTIAAGVALSTMEDLLSETGLEIRDLYDVVIPARTLTHRRQRQEALSRDESDKLARVLRIYAHTRAVFGSAEKTVRFLRSPKLDFDGQSPLQMMATEAGGDLVENMIWGIADGVFV